MFIICFNIHMYRRITKDKEKQEINGHNTLCYKDLNRIVVSEKLKEKYHVRNFKGCHVCYAIFN